MQESRNAKEGGGFFPAALFAFNAQFWVMKIANFYLL